MAIKKVGRSNYAYYGRYKKFDGSYKNYYKSGFSTVKAAKNAEEAFRLGISNNDQDITFDELVKMFGERSVSMNIKESTLIGHESYYNNHIRGFFGDKNISSITPGMIEIWKMEMIKKKTVDGKPYSSRTINHAKSTLSRYLSYAEQLNIISYNPCRKVSDYINQSEIIKRNEDEKNFWEHEEFKKFIVCVDDPYWNLVFTFMYETGVREGELFALTWNDIDFKNGIVTINKSITSKTKQKGYAITTPKNTNSIRKIDLSDTLLERILNRFEKEKKKDGFTLKYFVFGDIRPLSRTQLARFLDKYIMESGVKRITPHGFRHSHATFLIQNRIEDTLIAERLGHTVNELRKTYAHVYKSMRNDMKNKLNELYSE